MAIRKPKTKLEDYRLGYPRLAAFLLLDGRFTLLRRFDYLHMRSLLDQQDQLVELEDRLNQCDDAETTQLSLCSRRQDINRVRRDLLSQIRKKLTRYDQAVLDFRQMKALPQAQAAHRRSVENWFLGSKPLVRSESACYLDSLADSYVAVVLGETDRALPEKLLDLGLQSLPWVRSLFCCTQDKTADENIVLFPSGFFEKAASITMTFLVPVWLILHLILLLNISSDTGKAVAYSVFILATSFVVMLTTNTSKYNLILALLTYAALPTSLLLNAASPRSSGGDEP